MNFESDNANQFFAKLDSTIINSDVALHDCYDDETIEMESDTENQEDNQSEDLDATLRSIQNLTFLLGQSKGSLVGHSAKAKTYGEVMDDFVRNFLIANGCAKTLECFETEWFDLKEKGKILDSQFEQQPDEYTRSLQVQDILSKVKDQLHQVTILAHCRQEMIDKFRKERNLHRMHHNRIVQEKNKLIMDIRRLHKHYSKYDPIITTLKQKYETALRANSLLMMERNKLQALVDENNVDNQDQEPSQVWLENTCSKVPEYMGKPDPLLVVQPSRREMIDNASKVPNVQKFFLRKIFKGHTMSVSNVVVHPKKPVVVTASDDATWRMWGLPVGDLIMTGDGHKDWVAGLSFHPSGMHLASSSGDCSVKIWSFEKARCIHTFSEHTQAVWAVAYHDSGDVLGSSSLDYTSRVWDLSSMKCRGTLRGHVDSVNSIVWQPYSGILCTSSSDKTISLWDARNSLCVQTFYGHEASCNHATFNRTGNLVASADADGVVKLWDVRKVMESSTINVGPHSANKCCFDGSGSILAIASNDGHIKCFQVDGEVVPIRDLVGHGHSVQGLVFDPFGKFMISSGSDGNFRVWA